MINRVGISEPKSVSNKHVGVLNFKSNARFYRLPNGEPMETFTFFFRDDFPWKKFIPFIKEHFKNLKKVNFINAACSDGTESFSLVIALKEMLKNDNYEKFLPIEAYDVDEEVLNAARSGYVLLNGDDIFEIKRYTKSTGKYLEKEDKEILKIQHNGMYQQLQDNNLLPQQTYKVKRILNKNINFNNGDIFEVLQNYEDNGNTILFFRNTLGHFKREKRNAFVDLVASALKGGSLLGIGCFDTAMHSQLDSILYEAGFTKIMDNVYKKDTEFEFFIKKIKIKKNKFIKFVHDILGLKQKRAKSINSLRKNETSSVNGTNQNQPLSLVDQIQNSDYNMTFYACKPQQKNDENSISSK